MSKLAMVGALALVGVLVAGCATPKPTPAPTPTPTSAPSVAPLITPSPGPSVAPSAGETPVPSPSGLASPAASAPAASGATTTVSLEARDLSFSPTALEAPAHQPFDLTLHNAGVIVHNVTIDAADLQLVVSPGRTGTKVVEGLAPGTYPFYCSVSGHREAGMTGTLTVR